MITKLKNYNQKINNFKNNYKISKMKMKTKKMNQKI